MSTQSNTKYINWADGTKEYHRIMGQCCYFLDNDCIELTDGYVNTIWREVNADMTTAAIIDYKYPLNKYGKPVLISNKKGMYNSFALRQQAWSCDNEYKIPKPFFIVVTYLDDNFPIKNFYVIPANNKAISMWNRGNVPMPGKFMSLRGYSRFMHIIRNKVWNGEELIDDKNLKIVGLSGPMKLKDLDNSIGSYNIPELDFDWL